MGHNRAGNQLREVGNVGGVLEKAVVSRLPTVGIDDIGHLLEGKKADAQGQHNMLQRELRRKQGVDVANKKVEIFEIKQNPEVYQQGQCQHSLPGRPRKSAHDPGHAEIQHDGGNNDQQVAGVKVAVKPQGHAQQKRHRQRVPPEMVQPKVPYQTQGQKQQDENIGIKEQGSLSSLRKE